MEEKVIKNEIVLFENQDVKLEVNMKDETVWLNANQMSEFPIIISIEWYSNKKQQLNTLEQAIKC